MLLGFSSAVRDCGDDWAHKRAAMFAQLGLPALQLAYFSARGDLRPDEWDGVVMYFCCRIGRRWQLESLH